MTAGGVAHVCKVTGIAGSERHLLHLLPGLVSRGFEVHALVLGSQRGTRAFRAALAAAGIDERRVPIRAPLDPLAVLALARHLRRLRPQIVHTHLIHADLHGRAAAGMAGVAHLVSSRHNPDPFRRRAPVRWLSAGAVARCDRIIAISAAVARFVVEIEGADPARVRMVPYGLDPQAVSPGARAAAQRALGLTGETPVVGFVGRAVRQKGIDVLLDAFPRVLADCPAAHLLIVGDGPLRPALERQARRNAIAGAVHFAGWIDDAAALMAACDVVAIPSRWEGFGMVALEAMARARPIVASRVDALAEVVLDGASGLLVPPGSPAALAAAISRLLADPDRAAALGAAGRERLRQEYSVERMVDATAAVYTELLPGRP